MLSDRGHHDGERGGEVGGKVKRRKGMVGGVRGREGARSGSLIRKRFLVLPHWVGNVPDLEAERLISNCLAQGDYLTLGQISNFPV
jgi:hypothetical protein